MPSNSEYAQRQFRAQAAELAEKEMLERELRALRQKVQALEEKVAFLTNAIGTHRPSLENPRGFS